jgi:hypothetical protein
MSTRDSRSPEREKNSLADAPKISRRRFGRHAAAMAAMTLSSSGVLGVAQESAPGSAAPAAGKKDAGLTPQQNSDVDAKLANIIRKFGSRLTKEQLEHLRRILIYNEKMLASIRAFPLQNGDPPASVLKISRLRETLGAGPSVTPKGRKSGIRTKEGKS